MNNQLNVKQKGAFHFPWAIQSDFFLYTVMLAPGNKKRGELDYAWRES